MNYKTLQQISREHGVAISTLHERRSARRIAGRKIGSTLVFTQADQRKLLKAGKRGRPRKVKR